ETRRHREIAEGSVLAGREDHAQSIGVQLPAAKAVAVEMNFHRPNSRTSGDQALQFQCPVRCRPPDLPESALVSIASTVPDCCVWSSTNVTGSPIWFSHTFRLVASCTSTATPWSRYTPGPP